MNQETLPKEERLLNLILALLGSSRGMTAYEIQTEVVGYNQMPASSFERQFERDKNELRSSIDLEVKKRSIGNGEFQTRYRIDPEKYAQDVSFDGVELELVAKAVKAFSSPVFDEVAQKLLPSFTFEPSQVQSLRFDDKDSDASSILTVLETITQKTAVSFKYQGMKDAEYRERTAYPIAVWQNKGAWYFVGHDSNAQELRSFRLSRVAELTASTKKRATYRPDDFDLEAYVNKQKKWLEEQEQTAELRVIGKLPEWVEQELVDPDESDPAELKYQNLQDAAEVVLQANGALEVLNPAELQDAVTELKNQFSTKELVTKTRPLINKVTKYKGRGGRVKAMERVNRLLSLMPYLVNNPGILKTDAAAHFGISVQQLEEDLNLLFVSGLPGHDYSSLIDLDFEGEDIYVVNPQSLTESMQLNMQEKMYLSFALAFLAKLEGNNRGIAEKLICKLLQEQPDLPELILRAFDKNVLLVQEENENVEHFREAIEQGLAVEGIYAASRTGVATRRIQPHEVKYENSAWYVVARDEKDGVEKTFLIDRFSDLSTHDIKADNVSSRETNQEEYIALLKGEKTIFDKKLQFLKEVPHEGNRLVSFTSPYKDWIISLLLAAGDSVQVLSPAGLEDEAREGADV